VTVASVRIGTVAADDVLVGVNSIVAAVGDATGEGGVGIGPTVSAVSLGGTFLTTGLFAVRPLSSA
jgi:hypothetical protein